MPSVIISRDSQFESVFALQSQNKIGRSSQNHILLDAAGVSRVHACIAREKSRFFLIDAGSTNGTFVEDRRIKRHLLTHGTSFRIQDYLLTFVEDVLTPGSSDKPAAGAALVDNTPETMLNTLWLTQDVSRKKGLQQKVFRLLKMVSELSAGVRHIDPGSLVLDALLDITGAKRGVVAMQRKKADPVFTHMRGFDLEGKETRISQTIFRKVLDSGEIVYLRCAETQDPTASISRFGLKSVLCAPLNTGAKTFGCIYLDHPDYAGIFSDTDRDLMVAAADYIAEALLADKGRQRRRACEEEKMACELAQKGIIARSAKTLKVFRDAQTIAEYNVSVLIFGETGTGKEIIARYIHDHSGRKGKFIACNCSAITTSMFESELFGHEKGAFTGAMDQKRGILELADNGTIFLDEIGDMPAELQAKMLRALQEQEIWRVGGHAPVKINVRVIAATHKDIKKQRRQLNFRDDLYYRLANVEITAPSLRQRPEDIAPLSELILETFVKEQMSGEMELSLSPKALRLLEAYDWPGNIRELRNTLIQICLRCDGEMIEPRHLKGLIDVYAAPSTSGAKRIPPLVEVERVHIIRALKHTNWNKSAAAKVLSIDRNRLNRRIKKFGITSPAGPDQ